MNATEFMLNAKLGLLNAKASRPISNKGTIGEIRKRTEEAMRPPGFPSYANLGSQNAITTGGGGGHEARLVIDVETPKEPGTETPPIPPKELIGGKGGKQSEKSKKEVEDRVIKDKDDARDKKADAVKPPSSIPPFNLDTPAGLKDLKEWETYMQIKFWRLYDTDEDPYFYIAGDSHGYTKFLNDRLKAMKRVKEYYEKHPFDRFADAVMPFLVDLGQMGMDFLADQVKEIAQGGLAFPPTIPGTEDTPAVKSMKEAKNFIEGMYPPDVAINKLRDFVKNILPKKYTSFEDGMKATTNAILDAHPTWRARMKKDSDKAFQKELEDLTGYIDSMMGV